MLRRSLVVVLLLSGGLWAQPILPGVPLEPATNSVPLSADHREAQFLYKEAARLHRLGEFERAIDLYRKALARDPERLEYRPQLAYALESSGRFEEAAEQYDQYLSREPGDDRVQNERLMALAELGRWSDFDAQVSALSPRLQDDPDFLFAQGSGQLRRGQAQQALPLLQRVTELRPDNKLAWLRLAECQLLLQQNAAALATLDGRPMSESADWNLLRGSALHRLGRTSEAEDTWRAQLAGPRFLDAGLQLGASLADRQQNREALRVLAQVLDRDPFANEAKMLYARLLTRVGRFDQAWSELQALLATPEWENRAYLHELAGWTLLGLRRNAEALSMLDKAARLGAQGASLENNLALALGRLGRVDEALVHQRKACNLDPSQAAAWYHLGLLWEKKGKPAEARYAYRRYLQLAPTGTASQKLKRRLAGWKP